VEREKSNEAGGVARTRVEMTQVVLPGNANALGNGFGGEIMSWIDICGAVASQRHCRSVVVTASFDEAHFIESIRQGDVVVLRGQVNAVFNTSLEAGILVESENPLTGERRRAVKAYATYVALDRHGRPQKMPPLILVSDEDRRRQAEAEKRREHRLKMRVQSRTRSAQKG
jgi:acyl-CoA hydrolase